MDIMKIESKFMTGLIGKVIERLLRKKTGRDVKVQLNELGVQNITDDVISAKINLEVRMSKEELSKLLETFNKEEESQR